MMQWLVLTALLAGIPSLVTADFSRSAAELHPMYPGGNPFIVELQGTWPSDCHPGEQKPVVQSFDGRTLEIGFETIVVHITCNEVDANYRVLVDTSNLPATTRPQSSQLDILVHFGGETLQQTVDLICPPNTNCSGLVAGRHQPQNGAFFVPGLSSQGLLVVRQNNGAAIFPLVYDEPGHPQWLFSGAHMVEDTFFSELMRFRGGDCFGCEATGEEPFIDGVGQISVLVDKPGVLQVKVNDGAFQQYEALVFGYKTFQVGEDDRTLVDLEGRWGISENRGTNPPLGDLSEFFPGAFDLTLETVLTEDGLPPFGELSYLLTDLSGQPYGQVICSGQVGFDGNANICEYIDPTDVAEPLFHFHLNGPSNLSIEFARPVVAIGTPPGGKAIRLD